MPLVKIIGMVDPHCHLRDLQWAHKGTFLSETRAAIAGGYTAVFDMPNTAPSTTSIQRLQDKLTAIDSNAACDWALYFGASQSDNSAQYPQLAGQVCGLKIYNNATTGDLLIESQDMRARHYRAWNRPKVIAVHAESETVACILELVRRYRRPTHFLHISTAYELNLLTEAKLAGLPVTFGVCPHHLFFCEDDLPQLGALGLMKPELKPKPDQTALWQALERGIVDCIETDHAPHTLAEKASENPPYGVPGFETALPLMLQAVHERRIELEYVCKLFSQNVHRIWGITADPESYTLVDTDTPRVITREELLTACAWSPFEGMTVRGVVREVWIRGRQVYDGEQVLSAAGFGRNVYG